LGSLNGVRVIRDKEPMAGEVILLDCALLRSEIVKSGIAARLYVLGWFLGVHQELNAAGLYDLEWVLGI